MPKKKTRKSVSKRFRMSKSGKILFSKPGRGHLLGGKSRKRKRRMRRKGRVSPGQTPRIRDMLTS